MKSTGTANQAFTETTPEATDQCIHVVGIFHYLTNAYDVLNKNTLLNRLNLYGVRCNRNMWFKSVLSDCSQFVEKPPVGHRNTIQ
jgi:hypothetical protein